MATIALNGDQPPADLVAEITQHGLQASVIRTLCSFCILLVALLDHAPASAASALDSPTETTLAAFRRVDCMDDERYRYHKDIIRAPS